MQLLSLSPSRPFSPGLSPCLTAQRLQGLHKALKPACTGLWRGRERPSHVPLCTLYRVEESRCTAHGRLVGLEASPLYPLGLAGLGLPCADPKRGWGPIYGLFKRGPFVLRAMFPTCAARAVCLSACPARSVSTLVPPTLPPGLFRPLCPPACSARSVSACSARSVRLLVPPALSPSLFRPLYLPLVPRALPPRLFRSLCPRLLSPEPCYAELSHSSSLRPPHALMLV